MRPTRAVKGGVSSFSELLHSLPGVYPTQALASLRRLRQSNRIGAELVGRIEKQARTIPRLQASLPGILLPPHPLDFEWRFSCSTGKYLLAQAADLADHDDRVMLLGTPTLALLALKEQSRNRYVYVGENNVITDQVFRIAARTPGPLDMRLCGPDALRANEAKVVIVDPPWYFDFLRPMLRAAALVCAPGGYVLVSLPPIGTNSHITDDRTRLFRLFGKLSLNLVSIEAGAVLYETPYFEANALAADDCPNIPGDWRRGDLFILEKAQNGVAIQLARTTRPRDWHEVVIGRMRLFVTRKGANGVDLELRSIVPGDVLPTVRRGDTRRQHAQVWTSGNRIFACERPDLVRLAALAAAEGGIRSDKGTQLSVQERDAITRLSYALGELAVIEQFEERGGRFEEVKCRLRRTKSKSVNLPLTSRVTGSGVTT